MDELLEAWMKEINEVTYARLAALIMEIEKMLKSGQFDGNSLQLNAALHSAIVRMDGIRDEQVAEERKETSEREREQDTAVAMQLAEREYRLSAEEQEEYAGFLKQEYFTRADFDKLEVFYTNSWDRLSERGKTEMSERVWKGVRRNEFEFDELPEPVLDRETDRTYLQLTGKAAKCRNLPEFSQQAQQDIVQAYEAGDKASAAQLISHASEQPTRDAVKQVTSNGEEKSKPGEVKSAVIATKEAVLDGLSFDESTPVAPIDLAKPIKDSTRTH